VRIAWRTGRILAGCGLAAVLFGCSPTPPPAPSPPSALEIADALFEAGDFPGAAVAYQSHLGSGESPVVGGDRALFRLAVIELGNATSGTARGLRLLRQLVSNHPESPYRSPAELLLSYEAETRRLREQLEALKAIDLEPPP